jgi:hypothetical protein
MCKSYAIAIAAVLSGLLLPSAFAQAPRSPVSDEHEWQSSTLKVWAEQDSLAACAHLESSGQPAVVAERYGKLLQHLYNDRKDLPRMILVARAGIDFATRQAKALDATDEKAADGLRGQAKAMAYNLGANCWPGWKEPGITIGPAELAIGLDAARINLRLGKELDRPAEPLGHAHWLLGAQLLAAHEFEAAAGEFTQSAQKFVQANKPTEERMAMSYAKLALHIARPNDRQAKDAWQRSLAELEKLKNDDARFFGEQIRTAEQVFAK